MAEEAMLPTYTDATGIEERVSEAEEQQQRALHPTADEGIELLLTYTDATGLVEEDGTSTSPIKTSLFKRNNELLKTVVSNIGCIALVGLGFSVLAWFYFTVAGCDPDADSIHTCAVVNATITANDGQRWMCKPWYGDTHVTATWTHDQAPTIDGEYCPLSNHWEDHQLGSHVLVMVSYQHNDYCGYYRVCEVYSGGPNWNTHASMMIVLKIMLVCVVGLVVACCCFWCQGPKR